MSDHLHQDWISTKEKLPDIETPVLAYAPNLYDAPIVLEIRVETCNPMIEQHFEDFKYWDNVHTDGAGIDWDDVECWIPLPPDPIKLDNE